MKTKTPKPKARITSIAVSRLYNLGNYQNVKYDLAAEVPPGVSAKKILLQLTHTLGLLKPIFEPGCRDEWEVALQKSEKERSDWEKERLPEWTEQMNEYKKLLARRERALASLDSMGGSSTEKDAKVTWEDSDEVW